MATRKTTPASSKRAAAKPAAKPAALWKTLSDSSAGLKSRVAALTSLGWGVAESKQSLRRALDIMTNADEPVALRLATLAAIQSATFGANQFAALRPEYLKGLRRAAEDVDPEMRQRALGMLAREHDPRAQELLMQGLKDPDKALLPPEKALQLLSYDVHAGAFDMARKMVDSPPSDMARREALRLLAADAGSAPVFEKILADRRENIEARRLSASALQHIAPDRLHARARSIAMSEDEDDEIKAICLTALANFAEPAEGDAALLTRARGLEQEKSPTASLGHAARQYVAKRGG